jgi:hypothetical protein
MRLVVFCFVCMFGLFYLLQHANFGRVFGFG